MAEKKKQHYIPRFYLKLFSDEHKKSIDLFNIKSKKHIRNANLKNQCYEPYFYGKDLRLENAFGELETVSSNLIHKILNDQEAPKQFSEGHQEILTFVLLQHARTKHAEESGNEYADKLVKQIFSKDKRFSEEDLDSFKVEFENSVSNQIKTMAESIPLAMDLKCKILINKTKINLITSDNPVVFYNSACEYYTFGSTTGLASKGLKIIIPLSPKIGLIFYDSRIYKIGNKKQNYCFITEASDIEQLNDLQWQNCLINIYHDKNLDYSEVLRGQKNIKSKNKTKANVSEYPGEQRPDGSETALIHMHKPDVKINLNLACVKQIREVTEEELSYGADSVRDINLIQLHRQFMELVKSGKYTVTDFGKFVQNEC